MSPSHFTESEVEDAALTWLGNLGWQVAHGPDIAPTHRAPSAPITTRSCWHSACTMHCPRLNPSLPTAALEDAYRKLTHPEGSTLEARNRAFHRMTVDGVGIEYRTADGEIRGAQVRVIDFDDPANNDWLAVNQFTVVENKHERRPDIVLFVSGLPLGVIELKNPGDEEATIWTAWQQFQTYKADIPSPFTFNAALVISDGGRGPHRNAHRGAGVVQALANDFGRSSAASIAGDARGRLRPRTISRSGPRLHRLRG